MITVYEYPKSGGSWLVNILGHLLGLPRRDIYVQNGFNAFAIAQHPWYLAEEDLSIPPLAVVKSHEPPQSARNLPGRRVHLIRDGRDVVVSKYFFEKDFCVNNGLYASFDVDFADYVARTAADWAAYLSQWQAEPDVITLRYEDLLATPEQTIRQLLGQLALPAVLTIEEALARSSIPRMREELGKVFESNTFVRKGIAGDWRNHFSATDRQIFQRYGGLMLQQAGYVSDAHWSS